MSSERAPTGALMENVSQGGSKLKKTWKSSYSKKWRMPQNSKLSLVFTAKDD